jgi:microcystin-dependent protein
MGVVSSSTPFVTLVFPTFDTTAKPWEAPLAGQNIRLLLTGALGFAAIIYIPSKIPGMWLVDNQTTGSGTITVKTNATGSTGVQPPAGYMSYIFCDGVNVYWADQGNTVANTVPFPSGAIVPFGMTAVPNGWLVCGGQAVSRTTYTSLFAAIGTTWGNGDGSGTFNVPNLLGVFLRGWNGGSTGYDPNRTFASYQADTYLNHTHTATSTDAGHKHGILSTGPNANGGGSGWLLQPQIDIGVQTLDGFAQITTTVAASTTGGTETTSKNYAVQYCIKT